MWVVLVGGGGACGACVCGTDEVKQEVVHLHTIQHSWNKSTESTGEQQAGRIPEEAQHKRGTRV